MILICYFKSKSSFYTPWEWYSTINPEVAWCNMSHWSCLGWWCIYKHIKTSTWQCNGNISNNHIAIYSHYIPIILPLYWDITHKLSEIPVRNSPVLPRGPKNHDRRPSVARLRHVASSWGVARVARDRCNFQWLHWWWWSSWKTESISIYIIFYSLS